MTYGSGYLGSPDLQTSTANQEIIPTPPVGWTTGYNIYKFSFVNDQACHVKVNGNSQIFLRAGQGFNMDQNDRLINSFVIVESGITLNWIGSF